MVVFPQLWPNVSVALAVVVLAMAVDVRSRRIPNLITGTGVLLGLLFWYGSNGWSGALLGLAGAGVSPVLLVVLRAGHRPGMGDLKLIAAVGSLLGPTGGVITALASAAVGGLVAIAWMLRPGTRRTI